MNKRKTAVLIIYLILGAVLSAAGCQGNIDYYSPMMFAGGIAMTVSAIWNLFREYWNTRPENQLDYEKKKKEQAISIKDERKTFIRYKASYRTMQLSVLICFFGSAVLALLRANTTVITVLFFMALAQYLVASIIYKYLCVKL